MSERREKTSEARMVYYHINHTPFHEVYPIDVGYRKADKDTPKIANKYPYHLLHYVVRGAGYVELDGVRKRFEKGNAFVLPPGKNLLYYQDEKNPWEYYWINFNGTSVVPLLESFNLRDDVYYFAHAYPKLEKHFRAALDAERRGSSAAYFVLASLFQIFGELRENGAGPLLSDHQKTGLFERVYSYIQAHLYEHDLTSDRVAKQFYINPCYFSVLFKKKMDTTFKNYVNYERIKKASELLETTDFLIKNVAATVGFGDPFYFSRMFKRYRLMSPEEYREKTKNKPA